MFLNVTTLAEECPALRNKTVQLLLGESVEDLQRKHIATFGNSDTNKTGDWVKVLYTNLPDVTGSQVIF